MDYRLAMQYINNKTKLGTVPGLVTVTELLRRLGNPQDACKCLHIAGTNGKGSVFSFVQEILTDAGYRVGRYVSPTVLSYLERFQTDGRNMDEETFLSLLERVAKCADAMEREGAGCPTAFEVETAVAFLYFRESGVDYALIECGMGGMLDATNVIKQPVCAVIASVSMDHMAFLGDTIEAIAKQKAGIIKDYCPCVSAWQTPEVMGVLRRVCAKRQAEFICADEAALTVTHMDLDGTEFLYRGVQYRITLLGEHQLQNAAAAIEVSRLIPNVTEENIRNGLRKTGWAGRMTKIGDKPPMYVDGAHNEDAWKYLRKTVNKYFTKRPIIYIIGVLKDKAYDRMIELLAETMAYAVVITPPVVRGLDKETLAMLLSEHGVSVCTADSAGEAVALAKKRAEAFSADGEEPVILVCGSLSFLSDYLTLNE